ncbi:MAG: phosphate ABC transporter substrate-binding protein PstS [Acidobacteria bacterium]|nr:phosphate ABC transporter substrate-binding protein PstS [Acidobacteriota bacterium]MBS1866937.1 phosphate ABC transporter substrate-binding protein PstS [Acidobacteriota bacterium]
MTQRKKKVNRGFARVGRLTILLAGLLFGLLIVGMFAAEAQQNLVIVGTGSTVPAPLYTAWAQEYTRHNPKVQIRYLPVGTEEGLKELARKSGDFAAGEMPLSEKQRSDSGMTEIPASLVAIVTIYNLPQVHQELHFSGDVLADIYLGAIKNWNAPQIAKLNPGVSLPDLSIKVIQRPAGKGSNYIFSEFLSKTSSKFRAQIGTSLSPKWPVGEPAERSSDMADKVKAEPGSIGYVEYQYAAKNHIQHALLLNSAGKFVKASSQSLASACQNAEAPGWNNLTVSLINAHGENSYPMTSFTWIYLPAKSPDSVRAASMDNLLDWVYSSGQAVAEQQGYASLPAPLLAEVKKKLATALH